MLRRLTYRIAAPILWLGAACAPAGCSKSEAPAPDPGREVTMSFRIASRAPGSRAQEIVGTEQGAEAENRIDIDRARFLLFTQGGALLQELRPVLQEGAPDFASYTVTATIREPYFDYAAEEGRVRFRIMVLANWPDEALAAVAGRTTEAAIEAAKAAWRMPDAWMPAADGPWIPMYGLKEFEVSTDELRRSDPSAPLQLGGADGGIHLLRALARLEVIDKISSKNEAGYPRVSAVRLLAGSYNRNALLVPAAFSDGEQVTAPTLQTPADASGADRAFIKTTYTADQTLNPSGTPNAFAFDGWTTYLPEMRFTAVPALQFTVENAPGIEPATVTYSIAMPNADGVWDGQFLRNHIYRLEVTGAGTDPNMRYTYTICPWDERSTDISFE
ncbi:hypothetical protein [uncultured Alistipes sp.]|uniref:hypothetical protein n=1 Tax=uncultured Alistipes sp. TaxID=538949 RepID=UPI0025E17A9D|nr:hypothetical protein [uncultured Alistipes sp.]